MELSVFLNIPVTVAGLSTTVPFLSPFTTGVGNTPDSLKYLPEL